MPICSNVLLHLAIGIYQMLTHKSYAQISANAQRLKMKFGLVKQLQIVNKTILNINAVFLQP